MRESITHLVIVAGGKGTRLAAVAGDIPKALVPIGGKPLLHHQLELAAAAGVTDVTIFAGYLAEKILASAGDGSRFGLRVRVSVEREPMGNAGALLQSLAEMPAQFFVVYGDVMLAVDLRGIARQHLERNADFTALVHPNDHPHDSDLVEADAGDWVTAIHPSPHPGNRFFGNLVNAALYVVRRDALLPWAGAKAKPDFVKDLMAGLVASGGRVLAHRSVEYIKDMGTPERLRRVEADYRDGKIRLDAGGPGRPAVFLDRDGTLIAERGHLHAPQQLELLAGAAQALRSLRQAGFRLAVLTNQPVIARGEATEAEVAAVHRKLEWELGKQGAFLDGIYFCPHHPDAGFPGERVDLKIRCECRKPATGLFERARRELGIDAARSWMVGDQTADIEMAKRAGLRSVLVKTGFGGRDGKFPASPELVADDLAAAAAAVLEHGKVAVL